MAYEEDTPQYEVDWEAGNPFYGMLKGESPRGAVLVVAAFADEVLEAMIRTKFSHAANVAERLLGQERSLNSFSAKIDLAYCLQLISASDYADLHIVRDIRNKFAHRHTKADFDVDWVRDKLANMKASWIREQLPIQPKLSAEKFIVTATILLAQIAGKAAIQLREAQSGASHEPGVGD